MIKIIYPDKKPAIKTVEGREVIFCLVRKKWLAITPEEWVRQNFLLYLTESLHYSRMLIAVEKRIRVGELDKRFDIVVYNHDMQPHIVVECKEMEVQLSSATLQQILRYNIKLDAAYLVITNGHYSYAFKKEHDAFSGIDTIPSPDKKQSFL